MSVRVVSVRAPRLRVEVHGTLPDACTEIDQVHTQYQGPQIEIEITTRRPFAAVCAAQATPFTRSLPLRVDGSFQLWIIEVNGVRKSVALPPDLGPGGPPLPSAE